MLNEWLQEVDVVVVTAMADSGRPVSFLAHAVHGAPGAVLCVVSEAPEARLIKLPARVDVAAIACETGAMMALQGNADLATDHELRRAQCGPELSRWFTDSADPRITWLAIYPQRLEISEIALGHGGAIERRSATEVVAPAAATPQDHAFVVEWR
jgi:general stress protein 26